MFSKNDIIKDGVIAGIIGTLGDFIIHGAAFLILRTSMTAHYISQLIFPMQEVNTFRFLIGLFTHFVAGPLVGILLVIIFRLTGKDFPYIKGVGLGMVMWIVHVIIIPNIITAPRPVVFRTELEAVIDLLAHIIFGILATLYLIKYTRISDEIKI
jgi:hypothetical protein